MAEKDESSEKGLRGGKENDKELSGVPNARQLLSIIKEQRKASRKQSECIIVNPREGTTATKKVKFLIPESNAEGQNCMQFTAVVDILKKIHNEFTKEMKEGKVKNLSNPLRRLSTATGISERNLKTWIFPDAVHEVVEDLQVPPVEQKIHSNKGLDDFDEDLVKRTIHEMQLRGEYVSLRRLTGVLVERGIRITKSSLARLVKKHQKFYV